MAKTGCGSLGLVGALLCLAAGPAEAAVIPTLFNTGVSSSGVVLTTQTDTHGSGDAHYSLVLVPGGTTLVEVFNYDQWLGADATSAWIAPQTLAPNAFGGADIGPPGLYDYRTTFDLTGFDPNTASIHGRWMTDNQGVDIQINGNSTGQQTLQSRFYDTLGWASFDITGGFRLGINTLDFVVQNFNGPGDNPTGLRVEFLSATATRAADATTPEPATALLWCAGLAALAAEIRRRGPVARSS